LNFLPRSSSSSQTKTSRNPLFLVPLAPIILASSTLFFYNVFSSLYATSNSAIKIIFPFIFSASYRLSELRSSLPLESLFLVYSCSRAKNLQFHSNNKQTGRRKRRLKERFERCFLPLSNARFFLPPAPPLLLAPSPLFALISLER
jgi:hypothetical protein